MCLCKLNKKYTQNYLHKIDFTVKYRKTFMFIFLLFRLFPFSIKTNDQIKIARAI